MARKLVENKVSLDELITTYVSAKAEADKHQKVADKANKEIKSIMEKKNLPTYIVGNIKASRTVSQRTSWNEDALIAKIKPLKIRKIIKTREYIDNAELENAILSGKIEAGYIADCQQVKEIISLRIGKVKDGED